MSVGSKCPDIDVEGLTLLKGSLPDNLPSAGQVTVVEVWATWCGPCRQVFPHLSDVARKYKSKGLQVIGVTSEKNEKQLKLFVEGQGPAMDYTVVMDEDNEIQEKLLMPAGVKGIPHAFVVDGAGVIQYSGHPQDPRFEAVIAESVSKWEPQKTALPLITDDADALKAKPVKELKAILNDRKISTTDCTEKKDLVDKILKLCSTTIYYK